MLLLEGESQHLLPEGEPLEVQSEGEDSQSSPPLAHTCLLSDPDLSLASLLLIHLLPQLTPSVVFILLEGATYHLLLQSA